jgi:hypothetical protein
VGTVTCIRVLWSGWVPGLFNDIDHKHKNDSIYTNILKITYLYMQKCTSQYIQICARFPIPIMNNKHEMCPISDRCLVCVLYQTDAWFLSYRLDAWMVSVLPDRCVVCMLGFCPTRQMLCTCPTPDRSCTVCILYRIDAACVLHRTDAEYCP